MKFTLEHHFPCTPEIYWTYATQQEIDEESARLSDGQVELLSKTEENGVVTREQRFTMNRDLPTAMKKVLKTDSIGYELKVVYTRATSSAKWTITPLVIPDRVTGGGTVEVKPTANGCVRLIQGELNVKVPLIGKKMEERLIEDVSKSYDTNAEVINRHLNG